MRMAGHGAERLVIEQVSGPHGETLTIRDANDFKRIYSTAKEPPAFQGETLVFAAKWRKDGSLLARRETVMGGELSETYALSEDGSQLFVTVEMKGSGRRPKMKFRRVYDAEAEEGFPQPD